MAKDRRHDRYDHRGRPADPIADENATNFAVGPDGQPLQLGFDGQFHPLSYFDRPSSFERVRRVLHAIKPYAERLRPLERCKLTVDLLRDQR